MSAILTVDLGYGDSGKGTVVDALVRRTKADLVVRYNGGAQCAHNVVTDDGTHHNFHQYGSGTLARLPSGNSPDTLLGEHVRVNPRELIREEYELNGSGGFGDSNYRMVMFIDERCLITTPWHMALNRIRENARANRHGSCGMGVGETVDYANWHSDAPRMSDVAAAHFGYTTATRSARSGYLDLTDKLEMVHRRLKAKADAILGRDAAEVSEVFKLREFNVIAEEMLQVPAKILKHEAVLELVRSRNSVFEGAQGVLLDEDYGFHPYTTWSHTTLRHAEELVNEAGVKVDRRIGIIRTYMTRHGAGPLIGEMSDSGHPFHIDERHNDTNDWQQHWRCAPADLTAWNYAAKHAEGKLDGLAVTHVDYAEKAAAWKFQNPYVIDQTDVFSTNLEAREKLTVSMATQNPTTYEVPGSEVLGVLERGLNLPIVLTSHGPKPSDKKFADGAFLS